jgi:hypothetical protein
MKKLDIVLYRGSRHVALKFCRIGEAPEKADGYHYSYQPEVLIASVAFTDKDKALKFGHWIPKRMLVETDEVMVYDEVIHDQEPTLYDRVIEFLGSGPKKIGEIASEVQKPSAAIFSILSSAMRKEIVSCAEKTYSLRVDS